MQWITIKKETFMKITICIGSSCHLKGSRQIVEQLQQLVAQNNLKNQIELSGTLCIGKCQEGVNVLVDGKGYSVSPETVIRFFENDVLAKLH
jgi:NADH:ubiquinone oxidoreductase subunit E